MADIRLSGSGLGIASLALQVSECIMRLKTFWDSVKDAPEEIKHLIEEIKTLSLVLSDFDTSEHPRHEATSRCYQSCKKAVGTLDSVVKEVESEIKKRKRVGSVKAVLKKGEIEKLRERLVTTQSMLMLANNMYLVELQKSNQQAHYDWAKAHQYELQQLRAIVTQSTETILSTASFQTSSQRLLAEDETTPTTCESHSLSTTELRHVYQKRSSRYTRRERFRVRVQVPKWLFGLSHAIEIYGYQATSGWNFSIQVYNVVPYDSPIFTMARKGDIVSIRHLFSTGQASPFDRNEWGLTLLDLAACMNNLELCQFLTNEGADPNISYYLSPLTAASYNPTDPKILFDIIRFFEQYLEFHDPFEDLATCSMLYNFQGDAHTFSWILQASNSTFQTQSPEECVIFLLDICWFGMQPILSDMVRTILKGKKIDKHLCGIHDKHQRTLLHVVAGNLGSMAWRRGSRRSEDLLSLITDLLKGGSDLHALTDECRTPMFQLWYKFCFSFRQSQERCSTDTFLDAIPMKLWLKVLREAGVNLFKYGKEEKSLLQCGDTNSEFYYRYWHNSMRPCLRLINFTYGPDPEDWKFWIEPVMRDYFMDFWQMIDHAGRAMPGAWKEEYSYEDYDYYEGYNN
ncbi:hypothetical protein NA56DRAFT_598150 [Hyaloscypha hepaticicola]|uniref:Uncharacterized protein n=1 Tax=Hyaloscypha hepaticicola TaxID=2082293 RepID=A0A2J6Q8B7_9HELO|nr:hypothetical protein NA56DRAFT_598150 [Hyaloscypha hepaticicola]